MLYVFIAMQFMYLNNVYAYSSNIKNEEIVEDKLCNVKTFKNDNPDKKASLLLQMIAKKHPSGVVYALNFELFNNTNRNLVFHVPSKISEVFMTIIILNEDDHQNKEGWQQILQNLKKYGWDGQAQISQNLKKYVIDGAEEQQFDDFIIKAGDQKKWLFKMKDVLQTNDRVKEALVNNSEG
ncbi:MAG: hypothetical protein PHR16_04850 [Methylovulum sp.]|nr:hypothetical protein [Methylovulum sp.]